MTAVLRAGAVGMRMRMLTEIARGWVCAGMYDAWGMESLDELPELDLAVNAAQNEHSGS